VAITLGETLGGAGAEVEVVVVAVSDGSEAERSGLAPNDVVVEIGGAKPTSIVDARARLAGPLHDDVFLKVRRGDQIVPLRVPREAVRR
jgi:S1-C subfamily serine protease